MNCEPNSLDSEDCPIYSITTEKKPNSVAPLPQPATLDGLPAAVMTTMLMEDIPCLVYVTYTPSSSISDVDLVVKPFCSALNSSDLSMHFDKDKIESCINAKSTVGSESLDRYL